MRNLKGWNKVAKLLASKSQSLLARDLGVTPQAVSKWARRESRPAELQQRLLLVRYGIPLEDWLTPAEKAALKRAGDAA